ncbi:MAG: WD40 repeat domain-containing protein, partial [Candidatus Promineifilaceae bacterium]
VLGLVVLSAWLLLRNRPVQTSVETPTVSVVATAELVSTPDPGTPLSPRYTLTQTVRLFAFSPESSYLATADQENIYLWQGDNGRWLHTLEAETAPIESLAFTPNGVNLIARDVNGRFYRWLAFNGAFQNTMDDAQSLTGSPFALSNTTLVLVTAENNLELWPLRGSRPDITIETGGASITALAVSPDGQLVAAVFSDGTISMWQSSGEPAGTFAKGPDTVSGIVLTNNGRFTATYQNNTFQLWQGDELGRQLPPDPSPALGAVIDLRFVSEDDFLIVGYDQGFIQTWDITTGELVRTFYSGPAVQAAIGTTRDGLLAATLDAQGMLTVWEKPKE